MKEYDEPLVQSQVDDLYDSARVYIKSLKNEFTDTENALKSQYFDAIRNAGLSDDKKLANELSITQKQYDNLKNALEDAEKNEDDWDLDNIDKAPKISLDDYKSKNNLNDFDDMFDTVYKIVDAVSDAKLYNCTKIYSDLGKLKKIVNNFKFGLKPNESAQTLHPAFPNTIFKASALRNVLFPYMLATVIIDMTDSSWV